MQLHFSIIVENNFSSKNVGVFFFISAVLRRLVWTMEIVIVFLDGMKMYIYIFFILCCYVRAKRLFVVVHNSFLYMLSCASMLSCYVAGWSFCFVFRGEKKNAIMLSQCRDVSFRQTMIGAGEKEGEDFSGFAKLWDG
jgi:hypothetical protein